MKQETTPEQVKSLGNQQTDVQNCSVAVVVQLKVPGTRQGVQSTKEDFRIKVYSDMQKLPTMCTVNRVRLLRNQMKRVSDRL